MTAEQARQVTMDSMKAEIDCIKLKIDKACKKGNRCVDLRMPGRKWYQDKSPSSGAQMFFQKQGYSYCARSNALFW